MPTVGSSPWLTSSPQGFPRRPRITKQMLEKGPEPHDHPTTIQPSYQRESQIKNCFYEMAWRDFNGGLQPGALAGPKCGKFMSQNNIWEFSMESEEAITGVGAKAKKERKKERSMSLIRQG